MSFPRVDLPASKIEDLPIRKFCGACAFSKRCNGAGQFVIIPIALCRDVIEYCIRAAGTAPGMSTYGSRDIS